jgi:hypothetical protein
MTTTQKTNRFYRFGDGPPKSVLDVAAATNGRPVKRLVDGKLRWVVSYRKPDGSLAGPADKGESK